MGLADHLTPVTIESGQQPLVAVDPATRFVIIATKDGPERVDSGFRRVLVPTFDWQAMGVHEDDEIARLLVEASMVSPMKVANPAAVNDTFWVKHRGWQAMLFNEALMGKILIPEDVPAYSTPLVAPNQLILIKSGAGFYVKHGDRRGLVSNRAQCLLQLQFYAV